MKIHLFCVGKIKETYLREGINEFSKRMSAYCRLDIREFDEEKAPEQLSERQKEQIRQKEAEKILAALPKSSYVIALAIDGKMHSSEEMAGRIGSLALEGKSELTFLIGGSLGLSEQMLGRADEKWSFSKLTFPHQMMRLILLEQIYRSFRILNHEPYHK